MDMKSRATTLRKMVLVMAIVLILICGSLATIMREHEKEIDDDKIDIVLRNVSYPTEDPREKCLNEYWVRRERRVTIALNKAALILIDVWDTQNERLRKSPTIDAIVETRIEPLLKAAREVDMLVIHAPHRSIGWDGINREVGSIRRGATSTGRDKLPEWVAKKEFHPLQWPPIEFIFRVGEYSQFARNNCPSYMPYTQILGINPDCLPLKRDREYIESSQEKVREILRENGILHLFYVGGATNMCVVNRPVGIRRMSLFGYNTIILRDATLGSELADTRDTLDITKAAVLDIEINNGFSAFSSDFLVELKRIAQSADVGNKRP